MMRNASDAPAMAVSKVLAVVIMKWSKTVHEIKTTAPRVITRGRLRVNMPRMLSKTVNVEMPLMLPRSENSDDTEMGERGW